MTRFDILDHGYLELVEHWGSDRAVIEAARMSTDKGFLGWGPRCKNCKRPLGGDSNWSTCPNEECEDAGVEPGDEKLLRYLWENQHSTPFEFGGLTIEVQAPIAVFREWHRHRVPFGYSELSARYTPMPDVNYVPTVERLLINSKTNRQAASAAGSEVLMEARAGAWVGRLNDLYEHAQRVYENGLEWGVPKELARLCVPVGRYSRMRATGNLRGWLNFCRLRCAPQAQWEIRQYADAVGKLLLEWFPRTWELYQDGERKHAEEKAAVAKLEAVKKMVELWAGRLGWLPNSKN